MTGAMSLAAGYGSVAESDARRAIEDGTALPGGTGFAGVVDGWLVRDVLGRVPLYVEAAALDVDPLDDEDGQSGRIRRLDDRQGADAAVPVGGRASLESPTRPVDPGSWSHDPRDLAAPIAVPAGTIGSAAGFDRLWNRPEPEPIDDHDLVLDRLDEALRTAVAAIDGDSVGVAFSGGVDSALLAALLEAPLYVVGFPDSHDVEAARTAASALGRADDLTVRELTLETVEDAIPTVARAIGRTNAMDVGIATSLYLVAEAAADDGIESLVLGQGADELFGGYEKVHRLDHRVDAETVRGAVREQLSTIPAQLPRDVLAVRAGGVDPVTPYLHDDVVSTALALPTELYGSDETRKLALRRVAGEYLPASIATREKKAFQYGSLVARELDRLARRAGYKRRMDDHVDRYIASRLDESASPAGRP